MEVANALAYYDTATITTVKSFKGHDAHELKFSPARPDLKRNELSIKITVLLVLFFIKPTSLNKRSSLNPRKGLTCGE
jgi:hypothetical protein